MKEECRPDHLEWKNDYENDIEERVESFLYKRYYEETCSNLNTKSTEKIPFFISYKRDENYLDFFDNLNVSGDCRLLMGYHLHVGSQVGQLLPPRVNDAP